MPYGAKIALWIAVVVLAILSVVAGDFELRTASKFFGICSLIPLCILAAFGLRHVFNALEEGKVP